MAFESKRLRVQLPCKKGETLVEKEVDAEARPIPDPECAIFASCRFRTPLVCPGFPSRTCVFCTWESPPDPPCHFGSPMPICPQFQTRLCGPTEIVCRNHVTLDCGPITKGCITGTQVCGPPTFDPGTDPVVFDPDPENPDAVLLRPEDLGRVRRQLQAELEQLEQLEERRGEIEGQLKEIESAEKALKKRSKRK